MNLAGVGVGERALVGGNERVADALDAGLHVFVVIGRDLAGIDTDEGLAETALVGVVGDRGGIVVGLGADSILSVVDVIGTDAGVVEQNGAVELLDAGVLNPLVGGDVGDGLQRLSELELRLCGDVEQEPVGANGLVSCKLICGSGSGRDEIDDGGAADACRRWRHQDDLGGGEGVRGTVEPAYGIEGFPHIESGRSGRWGLRNRAAGARAELGGGSEVDMHAFDVEGTGGLNRRDVTGDSVGVLGLRDK